MKDEQLQAILFDDEQVLFTKILYENKTKARIVLLVITILFGMFTITGAYDFMDQRLNTFSFLFDFITLSFFGLIFMTMYSILVVYKLQIDFGIIVVTNYRMITSNVLAIGGFEWVWLEDLTEISGDNWFFFSKLENLVFWFSRKPKQPWWWIFCTLIEPLQYCRGHYGAPVVLNKLSNAKEIKSMVLSASAQCRQRLKSPESKIIKSVM